MIGMLPVICIEILEKSLFVLLWLQIKVDLSLIFTVRMPSFDASLNVLYGLAFVDFVEFAFLDAIHACYVLCGVIRRIIPRARLPLDPVDQCIEHLLESFLILLLSPQLLKAHRAHYVVLLVMLSVLSST